MEKEIQIIEKQTKEIETLLNKETILKILSKICNSAKLSKMIIYADDCNTQAYNEIIFFDNRQKKILYKNNWNQDDKKQYINPCNENIWEYVKLNPNEFSTYYITERRLDFLNRNIENEIKKMIKRNKNRIEILQKWETINN